MATKRVLYKPVQTNVGKKRNRHPLAQGRLVTAPAHPTTTAPRLQQGVVIQEDGQKAAGRSQVSRDDPSATPRRTVPRANQVQSPLPSPPIHTLDLSDSEEDLPPQQEALKVDTQSGTGGRQVPVKPVPQVMVLDASMVTGSPDVECRVAYERSPATVICHSRPCLPAEREEEVWQVVTDQLTKVQIPSRTCSASAISPLSSSTTISPHHNHNQHARQADGSGGEPGYDPCTPDGNIVTEVSRSSAKRVSSVRKKHAVSRLAQPSFEDSGESEREEARGRMNNAAASAPSEVTSDSETCSLFEYVPQFRNRPKTADKNSKLAVSSKSAKKKKGERTVASRYMQSAESKRVLTTALSAEQSVHKKKNSSNNLASLNINNSGTRIDSRKTSTNNYRSLTAVQSSNNSGLGNFSRNRSHPSLHQGAAGSSSPEHRDHSGLLGKTSTPTHDGVPIMASCDASAIQPELSMLYAMDVSHLKLGAGSGLLANVSSPRKQMKVDPRSQQEQLDWAYIHYHHWLFLDSKASLMLNQQEKDAVKQLHALWEMLEKTRQEKAEVERELARLKHLNMVDKQLQSQLQSLEPVGRVLPILKKDYSRMTSEVDTSRHQLTTRGVFLPEAEDMDLFQQSLEQVVLESEELLGTLSTLTHKQAPAIREFCEAFRAMEQAVKTQCTELNRCGEHLSAIQSLITHENSLRIQAMQSGR